MQYFNCAENKRDLSYKWIFQQMCVCIVRQIDTNIFLCRVFRTDWFPTPVLESCRVKICSILKKLTSVVIVWCNSKVKYIQVKMIAYWINIDSITERTVQRFICVKTCAIFGEKWAMNCNNEVNYISYQIKSIWKRPVHAHNNKFIFGMVKLNTLFYSYEFSIF